MLRAYDVRVAVHASPGADSQLKEALKLVVPILKYIRNNATGWRFWLRWGMDILIAAIESYLKESYA